MRLMHSTFDGSWFRALADTSVSSRSSVGEQEPLAARHHKRRADDIVAELVARSAVRAEVAVAVSRAVFVTLVLIRFLLIDENSHGSGPARAAIEVPVLASTAVLSLLFVVVALRRPEIVGRFVYASVLLDACACSFTLLPGVLYPWGSYRGILNSPDVAMVLVLCVSSGLRFSRGAAWFGALANACLLAGLVIVDNLRSPARVEYGGAEIVLFVIYLTGATSLGVTLATRGRRLAEQAAQYAMRADAARDGLLQALRDSHDAGSLLSAARIQADLLRRSVGTQSGVPAEQTIDALCDSLNQLAQVVTHGRQHAHSGVAATEAREWVEVGPVLELAVERAVQRFPHVRFEHSSATFAVALSGGARALTSILFNLLSNAGEGDGHRGAKNVRADVRVVSDRVVLEVSDDGPGFAPVQLARPASGSTKPNGAGVGLYVVERMVAANGGDLRLSNRTQGGALVRIELPVLDSALDAKARMG